MRIMELPFRIFYLFTVIFCTLNGASVNRKKSQFLRENCPRFCFWRGGLYFDALFYAEQDVVCYNVCMQTPIDFGKNFLNSYFSSRDPDLCLEDIHDTKAAK